MSVEKLRELKLYKKLQKDLTYRQKLQEKIRKISNHQPPIRQFTNGLCKINNNKKYLMEEQRNAQIERKNRILFQKIQSQATKSYYKGVGNKNHSSKTLNSIEDSDQRTKASRKNQNWSQNKLTSGQQQSRISFQQSQQMMRPKQKSKSNKMKMITELSPQIIELLKSRMVESRTMEDKQQQTVLFQGVGDIDTIKFKVKIFIKNKTYFLTGKNKHTEIMLKMELSEYKKFHKQVLKGNPSNIFDLLKIEKGQIRFRTKQEQEQIRNLQEKNQKIIYRIQQQEQDQNYNDEVSPYPKGFQRSKINKAIKREQFQNHTNEKQKLIQDQHDFEKRTKTRQKSYKNHQVYDENELQNEIIQKITIHNNQKNSSSTDKKVKKQNESRQRKHYKYVNPESVDKITKLHNYNTLQDYVNNNSNHSEKRKNTKDFVQNSQNVEIQGKSMRNRYKLPYI